MKIKKKIFFWSPLLSHVGTINAAQLSAESLKRYLNCEVYLINVFGEFDHLKEKKYFKLLNIYKFRNWKKTGFLSKFIIYPLTLLSIFHLIFYYKKFCPDIIVSNLVGYVPNILKFFFPKLVIVNSIQGYPRFNYFRKILWKIFYNKSDYIFTMTNISKKKIKESINYQNKIFKVNNPVINRNIRILSNLNIEKRDQIFFNKINFCAIGRLTRQKNFIEITQAVALLDNEYKKKFNILIIGNGEKYKEISREINRKNLNNIFMLGFKKNPYPYLRKSDFFISTSLWEEPGHAILEAGYLNKLIISSNCPNGPREILINNFNALKYESGDIQELSNILKLIIDNKIENEIYLKTNMKKLVKTYSKFMFAKKIQSIFS